jgi:hypothetical protein
MTNVLFVVSAADRWTLDDGTVHPSGYWAEEVAAPQRVFPPNIDLQLGHGRLTDDLRSRKPLNTIQFDVTTNGQLALHMPSPTSIPIRIR